MIICGCNSNIGRLKHRTNEATTGWFTNEKNLIYCVFCPILGTGRTLFWLEEWIVGVGMQTVEVETVKNGLTVVVHSTC